MKYLVETSVDTFDYNDSTFSARHRTIKEKFLGVVVNAADESEALDRIRSALDSLTIAEALEAERRNRPPIIQAPCDPCSSCEVVKAMQGNIDDLRSGNAAGVDLKRCVRLNTIYVSALMAAADEPRLVVALRSIQDMEVKQ